MKIEIDYNGSLAYCMVTDYMKKDDGTCEEQTLPFIQCPKWNQIRVFEAFRTIEEHWQRENGKMPIEDIVEQMNKPIDPEIAQVIEEHWFDMLD